MTHHPLVSFRFAAGVFTALFLCSLATSQSKSWPRFRGVDGSDHSPDRGLLKSWPDDGPKRLWLFDKAGAGYSGFSIQGNHLFTMGTRDDHSILLCIDITAGEEVWVAEIGSILQNNWGDGPRSTPTVDGEFVFTVSGVGDIQCVRGADGKKLWSRKMSEFGGRAPNWGYSESVLVDGKNVICTPGGKRGALVALDKTNGERVWQSKSFTGKAEYSSIVPAEIQGKRQYVRLLQKKVGGVDAKTGELLWSAEWPGRTAVCPTPIVAGDKVYVTSGYRAGCMMVEVGKAGAKILWQNKVMQNHHGGVVRVGDYLYGYSVRGWVCQKWDDGEEVWRERHLKKGAVHYADGMLYCLEEGSGAVALVEATAKGFHEVSRFELSPQSENRSPRGRIWVHPVVMGGRLFLRDQEYIYCYDVRARGKAAVKK